VTTGGVVMMTTVARRHRLSVATDISGTGAAGVTTDRPAAAPALRLLLHLRRGTTRRRKKRRRMKRTMKTTGIFGIGIAGVGSLFFLASPLAAEEIQLVNCLGVGARAMGMGSAYVAVAEDATALYYNPAGLAKILRIEVSADFLHQSAENSLDFFGSSKTTDLGKTSLGGLRVAYPFPTYRGSLVAALGVERVRSFDSDFWYAGFTSGDVPEVADYEEEAIARSGGMHAWSLGLAFDASRDVSLGATIRYWRGELNEEGDYVATYASPFTCDVTETWNTHADFSGWQFTMGALLNPSPYVRLGGKIDFPVTLTADGDDYSRLEFTDCPGAEVIVEDFLFEDEIRMPFSFSGGIALTPPNLILAFDARYTDWTELEYAGRLRDPVTRRFEYDATTDLLFGAEVLLPRYPVRLRGGYSIEPIAYNKGEIDKDRASWSAGVGVLIDRVLTIDAAYVRSSFERSMPDNGLAQELTESKVYVSLAYRM